MPGVLLKAFKRLDRMIFWWIAMAAWALQMFHLSTAAFNGNRSRLLLREMLALFHASVSSQTLSMLNSFVRTFAHVAEYGVWSLLFYRCLSGRKGFRWHRRTAYWCAAVGVVFSLTDEFHQALVPGRGSSLLDCGIDAVGIGTAILLIYRGSKRAARLRGNRSAVASTTTATSNQNCPNASTTFSPSKY